MAKKKIPHKKCIIRFYEADEAMFQRILQIKVSLLSGPLTRNAIVREALICYEKQLQEELNGTRH